MQIKHIEAEDMKKEMNEVQMRKYAEYDDIRSSVSFFKLMGSRIFFSNRCAGADAIVVYWIARSPLECRIECSNPIRGNQPLLAAKAVQRHSVQ